MTGTELAVVTPAQLEAMQQHARLLASARSELVPSAFRGSPGDVLMAIEYGRSLNLPVAQIFTELYIVKGRPSMSAKLMMALVLRAGHRIRADVAGDGRSAVCKIVRTDDPEPYFERFTIDDAIAAGLVEIKNGKVWARDSKGQPTPWERYTRTMLRNRAISAAVRAFCPDVLTSVSYTPDELRDDEGIVVDGTVTADPGVKPEVEEPVEVTPEQVASAAAENEAAWRTEWFDRLAATVQARDLAGITGLGQEAAAHGHADLIDTARAAWTRVQQNQPADPRPAAEQDQADDDMGGADPETDDVVDAELVDPDGSDPT